MITKVLFTLTVIIVVVLVFRHRHDQRRGNKAPQSTRNTPKKTSEQPHRQAQRKTSQPGSLSTRTVAYCILAVLMAISITVFILSYQSDNKIIDIRVIAEDGMSTLYQAKQKSIKGRHFVTLDGRQVTLGASDRIEMAP
ncbi:hypothetical protein [Candidatus Spongiihabitans sp.]|uniref:hypothetical protein n=1 Tax=Candidatus Spongiihabitans sp. TaxID=3101308 RepID=UPI003C7B99EB